jgi:hypothetical protein
MIGFYYFASVSVMLTQMLVNAYTTLVHDWLGRYLFK